MYDMVTTLGQGGIMGDKNQCAVGDLMQLKHQFNNRRAGGPVKVASGLVRQQ